MNYCNQCGTERNLGARFCQNCGAEFKINEPSEGPTRDSASSQPVFSFENLQIYADRFCVDGTAYLFSAIRSVRGGASKDTINFVPFTKSTSLCIVLHNEHAFRFEEDSRFLKGARHTAIQTAHALMRKGTFQLRLERLAEKLRNARSVNLVETIEMDSGGFIGKWQIPQVTLHCDAFLESENMRVNLKVARQRGTLWLGTERHSLGRNVRDVNPLQIIASEDKPGLLKEPKKSITFIPLTEDADIVHALVQWLSEDNNTLC